RSASPSIAASPASTSPFPEPSRGAPRTRSRCSTSAWADVSSGARRGRSPAPSWTSASVWGRRPSRPRPACARPAWTARSPSPCATWWASSSCGCRRATRTCCANSWRAKDGGGGVDLVPLSEVSSRALRPLLLEESEHWGHELHWDFGEVASAVENGPDRQALSGPAARDGGRTVAYCYYMIDGGRAIVGSLYAASGHS